MNDTTPPRPSAQDAGTPEAEVDVDEQLVQQLLRLQHPDLAELPIRLLDVGWDNVMYRLGEDYLVRLPRRAVAATLIEHEQVWLPHLAPRLPIPIPSPLRVGQPALDYPWRWSVLPWMPGEAADLAPPDVAAAPQLAEFLAQLHKVAPPDAPPNPVRGVPLDLRVEQLEQRRNRVQAQTPWYTPALQRLWEEALDVPIDTDAVWLHGDLHARNLLVDAGRISAVIDWGDVTSGDSATDLATVWMLWPQAQARASFWQTYAAMSDIELSPATIARAKGWALMFGVLLLDSGLINHPRHARMGEQTLKNLAQDA